jgi:hypothetical protein
VVHEAAQMLAGTQNAQFPFWSPDSKSVAFFADGKLKRVDLAGGPSRTLADASAARGGSWSTKGVIGDGVRLLARQVTGAGVAGPVLQVAQGSRSNIGYPRLLQARSETWIAWGNSGNTKIQDWPV